MLGRFLFTFTESTMNYDEKFDMLLGGTRMRLEISLEQRMPSNLETFDDSELCEKLDVKLFEQFTRCMSGRRRPWGWF